ncbi:MAG: cobalt-precorrin-5B (C(1))-methyltransferase [Rhodospirillaceae bacterium]|nr:cobalt-precorrin-5B (C(1))-methyltransferase [Rhodospirillaceae bacterium]|tara:strand:- start:4328 stop:5473 length:1146 start_codon:yes stop_codon:yes gene_type:complete
MEKNNNEKINTSKPFILENNEKKLRRGWTTGACAAAGAKAAVEAILGKVFVDPVVVDLPRGIKQPFEISEFVMGSNWARVGIRKDAGDDPDVTHGALILTEVRRNKERSGITFQAGEGVGIVTKPGLPISIGEPAITAGPRKYISEAVCSVAEKYKKLADFEIIISIPGGKELAKKTLNERLGVNGGLSILGTTGVVIPFSCGAWIASIHRGVDVARAAKMPHIAAATGRTSELGVKTLHGLPDVAIIDMGDFAGGLLKYLSVNTVRRLTIAGGFTKIAKLAAGHLDLHSAKSQVDLSILGKHAENLGANAKLINSINSANSGGEAMSIALNAKLPLPDLVAKNACAVVRKEIEQRGTSIITFLDIAIFDRSGRLVGHANG